MRSREILKELYDEKNDKYSMIDIDHKRRPRITLKHLQKLRKTRSIEELEMKQRAKNAAAIYGATPEE